MDYIDDITTSNFGTVKADLCSFLSHNVIAIKFINSKNIIILSNNVFVKP